MSLGVVIKGSEGVVLAADSRITLIATMGEHGAQLPVNFDNATKLLTFVEPHNWIGAITFGEAVIGTTASDLRTAQSYVPEFEASLPANRLTVSEFSDRLSNFFLGQWQQKMPGEYAGPGMTFVVGGFNEGQPYGSVYLLNIPNTPRPIEQAPNDFGITFGGQNELGARLLQGYDPGLIQIARQQLNLNEEQVQSFQRSLGQLMLTIPYQVLPLQDCINLAVFLIRTTANAQNFNIGVRGVGGAVDVAVITKRDATHIVQRKELVGDIPIERRRGH